MVSRKVVALAVIFLFVGILFAGCCCCSGTGSSSSWVYTGKSCRSDSDCDNGKNGWYCSADDTCQQDSYY